MQDEQDRVVKNEAILAFVTGWGQGNTYFVLGGIFFFGGFMTHTTRFDGDAAVTPAQVFQCLFVLIYGAFNLASALSQMGDVQQGKMSAEKIFKMMAYPSEINAVEMNTDQNKVMADNMKGFIEFKNVWFRYPTRKEDFVLKGLNLSILPNDTVALVGESGCGKSTFVNLMMRFYDVDFGEILIDGINIKDYNLHSLRSYISLVMQEPHLMNVSILENILYGKLNATNSEVFNATDIANCNEFIQGKQFNEYDDKASDYILAMEKNQNEIKQLIGIKKYDEEIKLLKEIEK